MKMFDELILNLKDNLKGKKEVSTVLDYDKEVNWEKDKKTAIIMESDTAIELGHPSKESIYFLAWTGTSGIVNDGKITIIGEDINEIKKGKSSYAEIVLIKGHGFDTDNAYERHIQMDAINRQLSLKGYMVRAVPQRLKNWCRVSKEAVENGFSFKTLGSEMIKRYKELDYVDEVEIIFITSNDEDVKEIMPIGEKVTKSINAMNKILENFQYDCDACDYEDVCEEFGELRQMHKKAEYEREKGKEK